MEEQKTVRKKKFSINKKAVIISIVIFCLLAPIVAYGSYMAYILYFRETPTIVSTSGKSMDGEEAADDDVNSFNIPSGEESGIDNIVLFGVDNRTETDHGRTDSIIIATIDKNSKVVKLTSIMRDLYVKIGSTKTMSRINAAYSLGGPELALKTLNNNFELDLKYYAIIDFRAFQDLVEKLDGIDINVKDYEVDEINKYIQEVNGANSTLLKGPGFQHLNGQQALSYARIRKVGNGDYERTERQRLVLKALAEKAKKVNIVKIPSLLTTLVSYVQTNVPLSKIISLGVTVYKFNSEIESMRVPVDGYFSPQDVYGASVLVPDIKSNAQFIKEFIYNAKVYGNKDVPSYMQNDFHIDDTVLVSSRPKPNIPNYSTPNIPLKKDEEKVTQPATTVPGTSKPEQNTSPKTDTTQQQPSKQEQQNSETPQTQPSQQEPPKTTTPEQNNTQASTQPKTITP